ncbi:MAG: NADH-quinone oxidoreductase subunit C [Anaerolineae bacterium]|nr:NADH-quinone oxidoreductase subunit C [Anaerolineae bacterium]
MTTEQARELLAAWTESAQPPEPNRLDVVVTAGNLLAAAEALKTWGYLSAITGLDDEHGSGRLEILYHFCSDAAVVTLRVSTSRESPSVPSICCLIPSAVVFERELHEMFGITVIDIPNDDPLFLPDDWAAGVYPLRKDTALD